VTRMNLEFFLHGGGTLIPLILASILAWVVMVERAWKYRKLGQGLREFHLEAMNLLLQKELGGLAALCQKNLELPTAQIIQSALERIHSKDSRIRKSWREACERKRQVLNADMKRYLWILGTIGSSAPFVGLAGTVIGILGSFNDMAVKGAGGFTVVAAGISAALIVTAAGIVVAVFAVVVYNTFQTKWSALVLTVRIQTEEFAELLASTLEDPTVMPPSGDGNGRGGRRSTDQVNG
jgi:biopolymer transport protein ExbB